MAEPAASASIVPAEFRGRARLFRDKIVAKADVATPAQSDRRCRRDRFQTRL
jgi:hypothetical protein